MRAGFRCIHLFSGLFILVIAQAAFSDDSPQSRQSLDQAANDPTASLMSVQVQKLYSGDFHNLDNGSSNTVLLRSALPFKTGDLDHIARVTVPYFTKTPSGENGFGDSVFFDLIAIDETWGRWGVGAVMLVPTASKEALGADKWAIGPALGFTARSHKLLLGLFNQNLFSVAGDDDRPDVNVSIVQPILNYSLPKKWSVGVSEMTLTYDWDKSDWVSLPLGAKLAKMHRFGKQPVQFTGSYERNFQDDYVVPEWTINFIVKFLFPV